MFADFLIRIFNKVATGSHWLRIALTPVGPVFSLGLLVLLVTVSINLDDKLGFPGFLPIFMRIPLAVFVSGCGIFLVIWSVARFFKAGGTPVPFNPPPTLVQTGPYRVSRNPIMTGVFLILFGIGIFLESVSLTFIVTPIFIIVMVWELKAVEEPELVKRFGEEYVRYREQVPMFFPGIRGSVKSEQSNGNRKKKKK